MASPYLYLALLASGVVSAATQICVWRESSAHQQTGSESVLEVLMGDSRRLFANHFITKADVYMHSGVYPSIFDQAERARRSHLSSISAAPSGDSAHADEHEHTDAHEGEH